MLFYDFIFIVFALVTLVIQGLTHLRLAALRRTGVYPARGQATMSDVARLAREGRRVWAMRCYRELHHSSLREAKQAIDALNLKA